MNQVAIEKTEKLLSVIQNSPTAFHAADTAAKLLDAAGFHRINEAEPLPFTAGDYYVIRGGSAIIAFRIPTSAFSSCMITASHSDSPMFKLKTACENEAFGKYVRLNTERYGGMILSSWFDRPLSVAGRLVVKDGNRLESRLVNVDRELALIPNVCIHFNRSANEGYKYNAAVDLMPLIGTAGSQNSLKKIVAEYASVLPQQIVDSDLFLYNRTPGTIFGLDKEFFSAPRIDNLQCAFGTFDGFLSAKETNCVKIWCMFDNEETGSASKQGAGSTFMRDVIEKIALDNGLSPTQLLASSLMVSADNAHARHPNHPELSDAQNTPDMNRGIVVKYNASQRYTTDAVSSALFREICQRANVPVQNFANRSDMVGGSTLGSISNTKVPLATVDIGMAQLAMHSSYETAGCLDNVYLTDASRVFYETSLRYTGNDCWELTP